MTQAVNPLDGVRLSRLALVSEGSDRAAGRLNHALTPTLATLHDDAPRVVSRVSEIVAVHGAPEGGIENMSWKNATVPSGTRVQADTQKVLPDELPMGKVDGVMYYAQEFSRDSERRLLSNLDTSGKQAFHAIMLEKIAPHGIDALFNTIEISPGHRLWKTEMDGAAIDREMLVAHKDRDPRFQAAVQEVLPSMARYAATRQAIGDIGPVLQGDPKRWEPHNPDQDGRFLNDSGSAVYTDPTPKSVHLISKEMEGQSRPVLDHMYEKTMERRDLGSEEGIKGAFDQLEAGRRAVGMAILRQDPTFEDTMRKDTRPYGLQVPTLAQALGQDAPSKAKAFAREDNFGR